MYGPWFFLGRQSEREWKWTFGRNNCLERWRSFWGGNGGPSQTSQLVCCIFWQVKILFLASFWCKKGRNEQNKCKIHEKTRNHHLTDSRRMNENDRKRWTWPKNSHRQTLTVELDRKYNKYYDKTNINRWILFVSVIFRSCSNVHIRRFEFFQSYFNPFSVILNRSK